jgi:adenine-specific DNA-methyltransferase
LATLGLEVSTGPVVPFRAEEHLRIHRGPDTVPMLWLQHVRHTGVTWPLGKSFRKPEHIASAAGPKLLVPNRTYVLLRRFSAKEDERRLVAAPYLPRSLEACFIGLENHVNFIYRPRGEMTSAEAIGLAALLNSSLLDAYFRISSGNTQVSATELRSLPLPSREALAGIATLVERGIAVDDAVGEVIGEA